MKSRAACNCDIETGHRSTSATLIANIAHKTKSYLEWDREAERFTNNEDANALLSYRYRAPYKRRVRSAAPRHRITIAKARGREGC